MVKNFETNTSCPSSETRIRALVKSNSVICTVQLLFGHPASACVGWSGAMVVEYMMGDAAVGYVCHVAYVA